VRELLISEVDLWQSNGQIVERLLMHFRSSFSVLENLSSCSNMVNWFLPVRSSVEIGTQAAVSGDYCRLDGFGWSSVRLRTSESFVWQGF
jgi:hypothetical protein